MIVCLFYALCLPTCGPPPEESAAVSVFNTLLVGLSQTVNSN